MVPKERIRILTVPPALPPQLVSPPCPLPPTVKIVTLLEPNVTTQHMLLSDRYDERVFNRVEKYFRRFYEPKDPTSMVTLDSVDVIFNDSLDEAFRAADTQFCSMYRGLVDLRDRSQSDLQQQCLQNLLISKNLVSDVSSNPISAWHGVAAKNLDSICWYGLLNLSKVDQGTNI